MKQDPIVEEVRQVRAKLLAECGDDLERLMDRYAASESRDKDRIITLEDMRRRRSHTTKGQTKS